MEKHWHVQLDVAFECRLSVTKLVGQRLDFNEVLRLDPVTEGLYFGRRFVNGHAGWRVTPGTRVKIPTA